MSHAAERQPILGVVGAGYVGATTAAAMAELGYDVTVVDNDGAKVAAFTRGCCPIAEPGLQEAMARAEADGRLHFGSDLSRLATTSLVFVCVPTPACADGTADTATADAVIDTLADTLPLGAVIVVKSTVPVGTADRWGGRLADRNICIVSNPEFLREGSALRDFLHPSRIVIGGEADAVETVARLYRRIDAPLIQTSSRTAELAKYASNSFLALKLSYINELADLAHALGADIETVRTVMGLDSRIGPDYLSPGPGWGGSCLPKDTRALIASAAAAGAPLTTIHAAVSENEARAGRVAERIITVARGRTGTRPTIAVLGLAFKAGIRDFSASPAVRVASELVAAGARVVAHDPTVDAGAELIRGVHIVDSARCALAQADVAAVLTDWPEYKALCWTGLGPMAVFDLRHCLDPTSAQRAGVRIIR